MDVRHRIHEFSNSSKFPILKRELDKISAEYNLKYLGGTGSKALYSIEFYISEDDPQFPQVWGLIEKYGFYFYTGVFFSDEDTAAAEWLYANTGEYQYPQPEDGYEEAIYDTTNLCPLCGMGAVQVRPVRLKSDFKQKAQFLGLHWIFDEMFVREEAKEILEEEGIKGVTFIHPLHHRTGKEIETVWQMRIDSVAEPGLVTEGLDRVTCKENNEEGANLINPKDRTYCGRVKYYYPKRAMITFKRKSLDGALDVTKSFEYFGSLRAAHRLILVSRKFADVVAKHKLRGIYMKPVKLV